MNRFRLELPATGIIVISCYIEPRVSVTPLHLWRKEYTVTIFPLGKVLDGSDRLTVQRLDILKRDHSITLSTVTYSLDQSITVSLSTITLFSVTDREL